MEPFYIYERKCPYDEESFIEKRRLHQRSNRLKRYGITEKEYFEMREAQGSKCFLCDRKFTEELKPHIDHDHKTGRVRGLLCPRCNIGLNFIDTTPDWYERISLYLEFRDEADC